MKKSNSSPSLECNIFDDISSLGTDNGDIITDKSEKKKMKSVGTQTSLSWQKVTKKKVENEREKSVNINESLGFWFTDG